VLLGEQQQRPASPVVVEANTRWVSAIEVPAASA
jgi:hypothetical protein